jgi:electron transfer DM13
MEWLGDLGSAFFSALYEYRLLVAGASVLAAAVFAWIAWRRHWVAVARRRPGRAAAIGVPVLAVAIPLAWYVASPLVLSATVDEPAPIAIASRAPSPPGAPSSEAPEAPVASSAPAPSDPAPPPLALSGAFHGSDEFHFGRGTARLIETAPGEYVVRLEDFEVRNGPDLYVYLSPDPAGYAKGAIEVGRLKADKGNQNYVVPAGALDDPARAGSVVIWCKQFSHLFATAPLAAA